MALYRKIAPAIWNDEKFMSMSTNGQLAMFFLLTHPNMTSLGAMRATIHGLASEHPKLPLKAFQEVLNKGFVKASKSAPFLLFPNFIKYNPPESPNVVKAWAKAWDLLPECELKIELFHILKGFTEGLSEGFGKAFALDLPESGAGTGAGTGIPPIPPKGDLEKPSQDFEKFWKEYPNKKCGKSNAFKSWKKLNGSRPDIDTIITAIKKQSQSDQWKKDAGQYIPMATTWLNQMRWDAEVETKTSQPTHGLKRL